MIRFATLLTMLAVCLPVGTRGHSAEPTPAGDSSSLPWKIGDREPDDTDLQAFVKTFLVEMRRYHGLKAVGDGDGNTKADVGKHRKYFDPRFLKKYNLMDGAFPVQMAPVLSIYNYQIADDRKTILCIVGTKENADAKEIKEAILLRVTVHERTLYVTPEKDPDPKTKSFTPWILRMKL